jgi:5-methyltetrahydrofolate--homocysteine methyltransferase
MAQDWKALQASFLESLLNEDSESAKKLTQDVLDNGASPSDFFENCITPTLTEIGNRFEILDIFLPEMVQAAEIVQEINDEIITPVIETLKSDDRPVTSKVLMATVDGDLHDIGKNMVCVMLQVGGYEVIDMGVDVSAEDIINRAEQENVDIIGMSSLLTSCLPYMKDVVELLEMKGTRDRHAVIIGGAAPTEDYARDIRVDAQGHSAADAVRICNKIIQAKNS